MPTRNAGIHKSALIVMAVCSMGFTEFFIKDNPKEGIEEHIQRTVESTQPSETLDVESVADLQVAFPIRYKGSENSPFAVKSFVGRTDVSSQEQPEDICEDTQCGDGPPTDHLPFFLEKYSLDALAMVGTLDAPNGGKSALIKTPDSGIVTADVGQYIGKNNGLIIAIGRDNLIVREKYRVANGWEDRMDKLILIRK
ncbi:pilus assembly protein PilP [Suttonella sp. R2A3]|uniref:pilus assembly protein PilP n=1 Tax=Suttonella sp. R2A3 TaxID=2908648 RepID=UPI001F2FF41A|nr:pilus assembly protein PilP [Suttonella sp. R2A3]UJF25106.1 pilus assembly protein PilP [Suttonella sp. R2A3]